MLIKCAECGHDVSEHAQACPNCGCPVSAPFKAFEKRICVIEDRLVQVEKCNRVKKLEANMVEIERRLARAENPNRLNALESKIDEIEKLIVQFEHTEKPREDEAELSLDNRPCIIDTDRSDNSSDFRKETSKRKYVVIAILICISIAIFAAFSNRKNSNKPDATYPSPTPTSAPTPSPDNSWVLKELNKSTSRVELRNSAFSSIKEDLKEQLKNVDGFEPHKIKWYTGNGKISQLGYWGDIAALVNIETSYSSYSIIGLYSFFYKPIGENSFDEYIEQVACCVLDYSVGSKAYYSYEWLKNKAFEELGKPNVIPSPTPQFFSQIDVDALNATPTPKPTAKPTSKPTAKPTPKPTAKPATSKKPSSSSSGSSSYKGSSRVSDDYKGVLVACLQEAVKSQLKSPSSAKFPKSFSEYTFTNADGTWFVTGWVEAQNSLGVSIRQNCDCFVMQEGTKFVPFLVTIGEESYLVE